MDQEICCQEFNPTLWDEKEHNWQNKLFIRDYVSQIMHIPLNMGTVIKRMFEKIQKSQAEINPEEFLMLSYDPSPWKSELYMTVSKEVADAENTTISGNFISKVYDGPYNHVPMWIKDFDEYLAKKSLKAQKYYFHYAYCPKCSKKYGHNYVIAFAQI